MPLSSRRIDTAHPDFVKLLADIQIYAEGIATTQTQNLNAWVDVARAEIIAKYQLGEHDKTTGVLQAAHVREGDYFSSRVHHDIAAIMEGIQGAHRGRSDSAPKNTIVDELKLTSRPLEEKR